MVFQFSGHNFLLSFLKLLFPIKLFGIVLALLSTPIFAQQQQFEQRPRANENSRFDPYQRPNDGGLCSNGGHFTSKYCSGLVANECGDLYQQQWTAVCVAGKCCTNPMRGQQYPWRDDGRRFGNRENTGQWGQQSNFDRGSGVCSRYGGQYTQMTCKQASNCGPHDYYACISGFCCYLRGGASRWNNGQRQNRRGGNRWNGAGYDQPRGRLPNGPAGLCLRDPQFSRFMGQFCQYPDDQCPPAFDHSTSRPVPIRVRCVNGACCGEERRGGRTKWNDPGAGWMMTNGMIPERNGQAYCYEGTRTDRQCLSRADCYGQSESCVNQLCCPRGTDETMYACGGLASNHQCESNRQCRRGLHCVSAGVCCECPMGQPQPGIARCSTAGAGQGQCHQGYLCQNNGFCCPQCPGEQMPFGSCHKGRCAPGFICRPGNICCEDRYGELAIGGEDRWRDGWEERNDRRRMNPAGDGRYYWDDERRGRDNLYRNY